MSKTTIVEEEVPAPTASYLVPTVMDSDITGRKFGMDIGSFLFSKRIIRLQGEVNDVSAFILCQEIKALEILDDTKDITIWIDSPGGSLHSFNAIYDAMVNCPCDIVTVATGMAASAAMAVLTAGTKGKRFATPNARILMHDLAGGAGGYFPDKLLQDAEMQVMHDNWVSVMAFHTGQSREQIEADIATNHNWFSTEEAIDYGIIDRKEIGSRTRGRGYDPALPFPKATRQGRTPKGSAAPTARGRSARGAVQKGTEFEDVRPDADGTGLS